MKGEKTGGRTAGTPNKNRALLLTELHCKYPNINPLIALMEIAETTNNESLKVSCYKEVARYMLPQVKNVEFDYRENTLDDLWSEFGVK